MANKEDSKHGFSWWKNPFTFQDRCASINGRALLKELVTRYTNTR